jgi:hypothetical protein
MAQKGEPALIVHAHDDRDRVKARNVGIYRGQSAANLQNYREFPAAAHLDRDLVAQPPRERDQDE